MTLKDILISGKITVSGGTAPTGEIEITENGTYDVTDYASALVDVSGGGGGSYETGEITIAETVTELTIPVTATWSNFAMVIDMKWADMPGIYGGGGDVICVRGTASDYSHLCRSAANTFWPCDRTPSWRGDKIQFNADSIFVKLLGNGAIAEFPAGAKYRWVAW